jgi:hypothetical protein
MGRPDFNYIETLSAGRDRRRYVRTTLLQVCSGAAVVTDAAMRVAERGGSKGQAVLYRWL